MNPWQYYLYYRAQVQAQVKYSQLRAQPEKFSPHGKAQ